MWRFLKIFSLLLFGIMVLGIGVAWWLLEDEEWVAGKTEQFVTDLTGRVFSIDGGLDLDLSFNPAVVAKDLRLANAPWASEPDMATVQRLAFSIDLTSIFSDRLLIHYIEADGVVLALTENEEGEVNWDLLSKRDEPTEPPPGPPRQLPYKIIRLELNGFTMSHESPGRKEPLDFRVDKHVMKLDGDGPVDLSSTGRIGGMPLTLSGRINPLRAFLIGGPMQAELHLALGDIALESSASMNDALDWDGIELLFRLSGPDFSWITDQAALPEFSDGPFDFSLVLDSDNSGIGVELKGDLGTLKVNAIGKVDDLLDPQEADLELAVNGPNLRALGETFDVDHLVEGPYRLEGDLSAVTGRLRIHELNVEVGEDRGRLSGEIGTWPDLKNSELDVYAKGPDISRWGPIMRVEGLRKNPFEFNGRVSNQDSTVVLTSNELLIGGHRLEIAGSLGNLPDLMGATLTIEFATPDISSIAILPDHGKLPPRPVTLKGGVGRNSSGILLSKIQLEMEGTRIELDGTIALADDFYGSGIHSRFNTPNLGKLGELFGFDGLPQEPLQLSGTLDLSSAGLDFDIGDGNFGGISLAVKGRAPLLDSIDDLAASFDISMPSFNTAAFLLGGKKVPDLPLSLSGQLHYLDKVIALQGVTGKLGNTSFDLDASVRHTPQLEVSQARVSAFSPDFHKLIAHEWLDPLPGNLKIDGQLHKEADGWQIEKLAVDLGSMHADINGAVDALPRISELDLTLALVGSDLSELSKIAKRPLPEHEFTLGGQIHGSREDLAIDGLKAGLGSSDIAGDLQLSLAESKGIAGKLHSTFLDLTWLSREFGGGVEEVEEASDTPRRNRVFSDSDVPMHEELRNFADLDITVDRFQFKTARLENIRIGLYQSGHIFKLDPFEMTGLLGGSIKGNIKADRTSGIPRVTLGLRANNMRVGLGAAEDQDLATYPPIDLIVQIAGEGATEYEMATSLNGRAVIFMDSGKMASTGLDPIFSDLLTELLNTLNPFRQESKYTNIDCGYLEVDIKDGMVTTTTPLVWQTEELSIISGGTIDLDSEKIDLGFETQVRKGIGISAGMIVHPFIKLGGTLAAPSIEMDPTGTVVSGSIAVATVGLSLVGKSLWDRFFGYQKFCKKTKERMEEMKVETRKKSS